MLIPSWIKQREIVWWKDGPDSRMLCRVVSVSNEFIALQILYAQPDAIIRVGRGIGEVVQIAYQDGLLELARA